MLSGKNRIIFICKTSSPLRHIITTQKKLFIVCIMLADDGKRGRHLNIKISGLTQLSAVTATSIPFFTHNLKPFFIKN